MQPTLAIIVPCLNEEDCIMFTYQKLDKILKNLVESNSISQNSFIIFIDDGSSDNTWNLISELNKNNPCNVKGIKFSRNFGNQKAILAGILESYNMQADCFITIDADLQQDENKIEEFIQKYKNGANIVFGIRNNRKTDGFLKKITALAFYKIMNLLGVNIKVNHSDYRLIDRSAVEILQQYRETNLFLRCIFNEIGLKKDYVFFEVKPRKKGKSKYSITDLMSLALSGITSFSIVPLRIVSCIGLFMSLISFIIGISAFWDYYYLKTTVSGWTTIVVALGFIGGMQILCIGIIGEYLGQLFYEIKARPRYIIETKCS